MKICVITESSHVCRCAGGKAEALAGIGQGLLQPFHVNRFQAGHSATDFPRWLITDDLYTTQYAVVSCKTCSALLLYLTALELGSPV